MTIEDLARDVESLKAENRRLKRWGAGVLLLGMALGGMAMAQEEKVAGVVRAKRFEVLGESGEVVADLASGIPGAASNQPYLRLMGTEKGTRALLSMTGSVPSLLLQSPYWKVEAGPRFDLAEPYASCGGLTVGVGDMLSSSPRVSLGVRSDGSALVYLSDGHEKQRVVIGERMSAPEQGTKDSRAGEFHIAILNGSGKTLFMVPE